jgi:hypothetical protein
LLILFGFAVLIGTMVTLPSLVVVVMNKLHAPLFELLKRREAEICKHRTKPKAFTEEPPKKVHPESWCGKRGVMAKGRDEPEFAISRVWRARGLRVSQHEVCRGPGGVPSGR